MQKQTQKAVVIHSLEPLAVFGDFEIPQPGPGDVLIKVIASTINPSDKLSAKGFFGPKNVPFVAGLQGYGEVIKAGSPQNENLVGKKVSFITFFGAWTEYTVAPVHFVFVVDNDVPLESAAAGISNPLTVIGMVDTYQKWSFYGQKGKGIINTTAASSLGRMLNKYCIKLGIPILNIVRRQQQVKILKEDGAKYIINTSDANWLDQYKEFINTQGFNVLFDALGGGSITGNLLANLKPGSQVYFYGKNEPEPVVLTNVAGGFQGTSLTDFSLFNWYSRVTPEEKQKIQEQYSSLLKKQLSTYSFKQIGLKDVPEFWDEAEKRGSEGKVTIKI